MFSEGALQTPRLSLRPFHRILEVQTIFVIIEDFICPFIVDIGTDGVKATVRKTADTLSWLKAVTPNCTGGHTNPVSLQNVLGKAGGMIEFISALENTSFNILCDEMISMLNHFCCILN